MDDDKRLNRRLWTRLDALIMKSGTVSDIRDAASKCSQELRDVAETLPRTGALRYTIDYIIRKVFSINGEGYLEIEIVRTRLDEIIKHIETVTTISDPTRHAQIRRFINLAGGIRPTVLFGQHADRLRMIAKAA